LPAIWRAAAVKRLDAVSGETEVVGFRAASQPIAGKPDAYALRAEADLGRCTFFDSGRSPQERGLPAIWRAAAVKRLDAVSGETEVAGFRAASQPIDGKPDAYALRAEADLGRCTFFDSGRSP
jgi:hypothetical protein